MGAAAAAAAGALVLWILWGIQDRGRIPPDASLSDLVPLIAEGRPAEIDRARQMAAGNWPAAAPTVLAMLGHERWQARAAACEILARQGDARLARDVFPRASDKDWRVRAAAMTALARWVAAGPPPVLRDAPLEERERWLLGWLAACRLPEGPTAEDLCELYAGAGDVEFGETFIDRCLRCHAGAPPAPPSAADTCRRCHAAVHEGWSASAHAQSLTHLRLATIDPQTREPRWADFGDLRGIGCFECHPATGRPDGGIRPDGPRGTACPYTFGPAKAGAALCARCHASTAQEWKAWRAGPQPRRAVFPPGEIDLKFRGDERDCVACHMPRPGEGEPAGPPRHDWAARRDVGLLRSGIDLAAVRSRDQGVRPAVRLTLTNLSGHAYPTGTRRRAVRLYAGPEGGEEALIAAFSAAHPGGGPADAAPPLAPGEQRGFLVPVTAEAGGFAYRLVYYRDAADPRGYVAEILSGTLPLGSWPSP